MKRQAAGTGALVRKSVRLRRDARLGLFSNQYGAFDAGRLESAKSAGLQSQLRLCVPALSGEGISAVERL
jgi:hypothetical protein